MNDFELHIDVTFERPYRRPRMAGRYGTVMLRTQVVLCVIAVALTVVQAVTSGVSAGGLAILLSVTGGTVTTARLVSDARAQDRRENPENGRHR